MKTLRSLLFILSLLVLSPAVFAGWSITNQSASNGSQISTGATMGLTVNAGDTIIITVNGWTGFGAVTSITPNVGTCGAAFVQLVGLTPGGGVSTAIWAAPNCQAAITGVTINFTGGGTQICSAMSVSGLASTITTDGTNTATGASSGTTTPTGPSVTTSKTGDFIVGTWDPAHSVSGTAPTDWTMTCPGCSSVGSAYLTSTSAAPGSYAPTTWHISSDGAFAAATAAFATPLSNIPNQMPTVQ